MKLSHENKNDEPVIGMWMIDGQQITPMRENVPMKNPLKAERVSRPNINKIAQPLGTAVTTRRPNYYI